MLLFLGTTVNYLARIVLSILLPEIRKENDDILYGKISSAFISLIRLASRSRAS